MSITQKMLKDYMDNAADLVEQIKVDIKDNDGIISDHTIVALNQFIISENALADLTTALNSTKIKLN